MSLLLAQDAQRQEVLLGAGTRAVQGSKRIFGRVLSVLPDAPKLRLRGCEVKKDALRLQPNQVLNISKHSRVFCYNKYQCEALINFLDWSFQHFQFLVSPSKFRFYLIA